MVPPTIAVPAATPVVVRVTPPTAAAPPRLPTRPQRRGCRRQYPLPRERHQPPALDWSSRSSPGRDQVPHCTPRLANEQPGRIAQIKRVIAHIGKDVAGMTYDRLRRAAIRARRREQWQSPARRAPASPACRNAGCPAAPGRRSPRSSPPPGHRRCRPPRHPWHRAD